jgi:bifunctional DNA-binding transcriptional regulator/antitoxin component of YhaV-PrlF toxin-antitoxin module
MREAGIEVGDELLVRTDSDGRVVLVRERGRFTDFIGSMPGLAAAVDLEELRSEWER